MFPSNVLGNVAYANAFVHTRCL